MQSAGATLAILVCQSYAYMHSPLYVHSSKQISLSDKLIEDAFLLDKIGRCVEFGNSALAQNDNTIRIEDGIDPMCNRYDGAIFEHTASQGCLHSCVSLNVDGRLFRDRISDQDLEISNFNPA